MTEQTQPTDAELLDAADDFRSQYTHGGTTFDEFDALGFARAVLTKWGSPAQATKCKCTLAQRCTGSGCRYCNPQEYIDMLHEQIADARSDQAAEPVGLVGCDDHCASILTGTIARLNEPLPTGTKLFTAPQPVAREPLTDEQIEALPMWKRFVGLWPETRREIVRTIERHHGIKGGQHGTE